MPKNTINVLEQFSAPVGQDVVDKLIKHWKGKGYSNVWYNEQELTIYGQD